MKSLLILLLVISWPLYATDTEREQRWVEQTVDTIFDGEPVFLAADGHQFLGIYTPAQAASDSASNKGIIVLHGTGLHPDWEQVVQPIRVKMTERGWNTLSIQLPLLEASAKYEDYVPLYVEVPARIQAATKYLADRGVETIVIVAHSQGATMASYYLARSEHNIQALVAIGMSAQHSQPDINSAASLKLIDIPVLDIYGGRDFPSVLQTAEKRRLGAAHNERYQQIVIPDAYHFFDNTDHEKQLIEVVDEWLQQK